MVAQASVWRVNNQEEFDADFTNITDAHDSPMVVNGDTVYLEGSPENYGALICSKKLVIIGPGYFLTENKPYVQVYPASMQYIYFNPGSENSKIIGLAFNAFSNSAAYIFTNFISVERCFMEGSLTLGNVTGARIVQNYLGGVVQQYVSTAFADIIFNNNILFKTSISINNNCNFSTFNNNILKVNAITLRTSAFRNNILTNASATVNVNSSFIEKNICTNNILGGDNLNVTDIQALFVGGASPDGQYQLSQNSQAIGAGYNGVDCGVFGGDDPYVISGLPPLPLIVELEVDDAASIQSGLRVKIKVISN